MLRILSSSLLVTTLATAATAQTPIVTETFEYPVPGLVHQMAGGMGWSNAWFVNGPGNDGVVMFDNTITPNFSLSDGVGGHAGTALQFNGGFRQLDLAAQPDLVDPNMNMWGADGNTIWVAFSTVNFQGLPQEHFGGVSLWKAGQADPEALFLGSPWNSMGWGYDDQGGNGAPEVVLAGSDDTIAARLVYRIDFLPGDERIRMYVDPATEYPTGAADLDGMLTDLRFDEIRIEAGGNNGDAYFWDNLVISLGDPSGGLGSNYCMTNPNSTGMPGSISASGSADVAMNDVTLLASALPNASFGFFLASTTQAQVANPGGSDGNLCLGGAIGRYVGPGQIQNTGNAGEFSLVLDLTQTPTPTGFVSIAPGQTWNYQAWHRDAIGGMATSNFTDGLEIMFQ